MGLDEKSAMRIASSLGGGVGRLREMCGALLGAEMVLGMMCGYDTPETGEIKAAHYARVQELAHRFQDVNGSMLCRELLHLSGESVPVPSPRTEAFYQQRPCPGIVKAAAILV